MRLAAHHPELIRNAYADEHHRDQGKAANRIKYAFLAQMVKIFSPAPFTPIAVKGLFGQTTRRSAERDRCWNNGQGSCGRVHGISARSLSAVMNRREFRADELAAIQCPTLIITGEDERPNHRAIQQA